MTEAIAHGLRLAFADVIAEVGEHEGTEFIAAKFGITEDEFCKLRAGVATYIDATFQSEVWPPTTQTDRRAGLALAFGFGMAVALKALRED